MEDDKQEPWRNPDENEFGIDLERLRRNLLLTPEERLEKHQRGLECVLALREAAKHRRVRANLQ